MYEFEVTGVHCSIHGTSLGRTILIDDSIESVEKRVSRWKNYFLTDIQLVREHDPDELPF